MEILNTTKTPVFKITIKDPDPIALLQCEPMLVAWSRHEDEIDPKWDFHVRGVDNLVKVEEILKRLEQKFHTKG